MEQYIPKSAALAEIEKLRSKWFGVNNDFAHGEKAALTDVLSFFDTLEVKEVDLEKEAERFVQTKEFAECKGSPVMVLAKHFFELGMSVSNQLTWEDIKNLESLCIQKRVKDGLFDKEDYEEVLKRFKVQKGE